MTTRKRSSGEGTVFRDTERGGWVGQLWIDGRRRKVRGPTKVDVSARLNQLRHQADEGTPPGDGNATVGDLLDLWAARVLANRDLGPSARLEYERALRVLTAEYGTIRLRSLTVDAVEAGLDRIATGRHGRGRPLSRRSLKLMRSTLAQVLTLGVRRRLIAHNPALLAELTPTAARPVPRNALTPAEARRLWDAVDGERLGNFVKLMLTTGLRPGEALGLCWDSVDVDAGTLTVRRAVRLERGKARLVDDVKTKAAFRTIGLPAPAVDVLRAQRRSVAALKLAARTWAVDDPGLVFPTVQGTPWNPANVRRELYAVCDAAGLPRVRPHELRHTAASVLSDQGVPLELIADLLGHVDVTMVSQVYRHRVRPSVDAAIDVMNTVFGT